MSEWKNEPLLANNKPFTVCRVLQVINPAHELLSDSYNNPVRQDRGFHVSVLVYC